MIGDVVPLVRELVPGLLTHPSPSVVCVRTTHAKYLVFEADPLRPACVVEIGHPARLVRTHRILRELHRRVPDAVAQPLCCTEWRHGNWVQVQDGLPGLPWFRLADGLTTPAAWSSLLERALRAMRAMHAAIKDVPEWQGTVNASGELDEQMRLARACPAPIDDAVLGAIEESARHLGSTRAPAAWQHGDFSLNNLMVAPHSMAIIDFEEFGHTMVPLHDAFGLALSFPLSQGGRCPIDVAECLDMCVRPALRAGQCDEAALRGLLFHHLLWRINQTYGLPTRAPLRAQLTHVAARVAASRGDWRTAVAAAFE
jgi:hypothetical protein